MKIKTKELTYREVEKITPAPHRKPKKTNPVLRGLIKILSKQDFKETNFSYETERMELCAGKPCLILMNHSCFMDLEMAFEIFNDRKFCIVCTSDGFVGKPGLMRNLGCIPTNKFVSDVTLIRDINYAINRMNVSVLMYPEASYSFDGCPTPLPRKLGVLMKKLKAPVVTVITEGAFHRDPLYNCLQKRKVNVRAKVECLFTPEEIEAKSVEELDRALDEKFTFDNFAWQRDNKIRIDENFRADGLERILYKCPHCLAEGKTKGSGIKLRCNACGKEYKMDEYGALSSENAAFTHIPDWYKWEREEVKKELLEGTYKLDENVKIGVLADEKAIYMIGNGRLTHTPEGFHLESDDGDLVYDQKPLASYSLYADYFWYELGDIVCIGTNDKLFYCFPGEGVPVAKARLATEELYKIKKKEKIMAKTSAKGE